jgi:AP2 domain/HNH endonuclease
MITAKRLRELLDYDSATGVFTWRVDKGRVRVGDRAGSVSRRKKSANGLTYQRRFIKVDQINYTSSRLAWLYTTRKWPREMVDHKNCDALDDSWENLREASHAQNGANQRNRRQVPFKGVSWQKDCGKFMAHIRVNYRKINLGRFNTAEAAHAAYIAAAKQYFGEFARAK